MGLVRVTRALRLVTLVGIFGSSPVSAVPFRVEAPSTSVGGCESVAADVVRWRPSDGPLVAFLAERFLTQEYGNTRERRRPAPPLHGLVRRGACRRGTGTALRHRVDELHVLV
jgi:hypothetical protein